MRAFRPFLLATLAFVLCAGMAKKPEFTVRFHTEANPRDTERFAKPIDLKYPPRSAFMEKTPSISERMIAGIYPFQAPDGTFGCVFKLDADGRINLESLTTQRRGTSLVVFIGTKNGVHQVTDMMIDKPVRDGVLTVQRGITPLEVEMLKKKFQPVLPKDKEPVEKPPEQ